MRRTSFMRFNLKRSNKRFLALLTLLPISVLVLALIYMEGMDRLEQSPRTFLQSIQWAAETVTTTGYGADSRWNHPGMALFVILGQFFGQFLVFLIFPLVILPYFEERFEARFQHALPAMDGKVLFYRYGPAIESLLSELKTARQPFLIFEEDSELARHLRDLGHEVVLGKLAENPSALAGIDSAKAVVANADDHANATFTLMERELG